MRLKQLPLHICWLLFRLYIILIWIKDENSQEIILFLEQKRQKILEIEIFFQKKHFSSLIKASDLVISISRVFTSKCEKKHLKEVLTRKKFAQHCLSEISEKANLLGSPNSGQHCWESPNYGKIHALEDQILEDQILKT
jgi:hypothetical protein